MRALVCVAILSLSLSAAADTDKLVVGTVAVPPFIIKNDDGSWGGISMDLWKEVARRLDLKYEIREMQAADLKDPQKLADLDVFVSLNISAEIGRASCREKGRCRGWQCE